MTLGVYWYFGFPEGLYHFRYFTFSPGRGGHADGPAELTARVRVPDPAGCTQALTRLLARHTDVYFFAYQHGPDFQLITGDYQLYDYHFALAAEVDALLHQESAQPSAATFTEADRLVRNRPPAATSWPTQRLLQVVGSERRLHNAETLALRLDCHLKTDHKPAFISHLRELAQAANLHVFYYYFHELAADTNLMLFFTNGRQGVGLQAMQEVNTQQFEQQVSAALQAHGGQPKHTGGYEQYPQNGPVVELITDQDYTL